MNNGKSKFFKYLFWLAVICGICYYAYNNLYLPTNLSEIAVEDSLDNSTENVNEDTSKNTDYKQPQKMIQIEVLNGCGKSGIAKIFESHLRQNGFDVINTDNFRLFGKINWNVPNSKVIDQLGKLENAQAVAQSLGIDDKFVSSNVNKSPTCDVTVVIGKDFDQIKGFKEFSK